MKVDETRLAIGGLMRCCTGTLSKWAQEHQDEELEDGTIVECEYCSESMILDNGTWRWNKKEEGNGQSRG